MKNAGTVVDNGGNIGASAGMPGLATFPYPLKMGWSVDDIGAAVKNAWFNGVVNELYQRGGFVDGAVICGTAAAEPTFETSARAWYQKGVRYSSHSWGHQYPNTLGAFSIQYTGSSPCSLSLSKAALTSTGCDGAALSFPFSDSRFSNLKKLCRAIDNLPAFTCKLEKDAGTGLALSFGLQVVSSLNLGAEPKAVRMDESRMLWEDAKECTDWLDAKNFDANAKTSETMRVYVLPGGYRDSVTDSVVAISTGYGRGTGFKDSHWSAATGHNLRAVWQALPYGVMGLDQAEIERRARGWVVLARTLGKAVSFYSHMEDNGKVWVPREMGDLYTALTKAGVEWLHLDQWVAWLQQNFGQVTLADEKTIVTPLVWIWRPNLAANSPLLGAGGPATTKVDIMNRTVTGNPDIGAYERP